MVAALPPKTRISWPDATRIIRSHYPPIDLFEDIADPEDWPLLMAAEMKTNPRIAEAVGNLDLVAVERRVSGPGASYLMAPFTHTSPDRPSRFSDGALGVLYVAGDFETALAETIHHHSRFMARTAERPGWTSHFRELSLTVGARCRDIRIGGHKALLSPDDYGPSQIFAAALRADPAEDGIVYPSVRGRSDCAALFHPDLARQVRQGRHLDYHWNGARVDLIRELPAGRVFRISED